MHIIIHGKLHLWKEIINVKLQFLAFLLISCNSCPELIILQRLKSIIPVKVDKKINWYRNKKNFFKKIRWYWNKNLEISLKGTKTWVIKLWAPFKPSSSPVLNKKITALLNPWAHWDTPRASSNITATHELQSPAPSL